MAYATEAKTSALAARYEAVMTVLRERMERRRVFKQTFHELASLSDRELNDLGMARSEIRRVAWQAAQEAI